MNATIIRAAAPFVALALALPAGAGAPLPPDPLDLAWCVERALEANPEIAIDAASAEAARARILPAGALDDPRFGYDAVNLPVGRWDFDSTPMSGNQLGIRQRLPFPGLLGHRERAARAAADAAGSVLEDRRLRIRSRARALWAELGYAQRALAITRRNIALVRQLARIAEARYAVGRGLQQDVIRAQVELTRLLDQEIARRAAVERAGAALVSLLDLPPDQVLPETAPLPDESPVPALEGLYEGLETRHPRLRALAARVEEADRLRRVAELEGYPDFDLGIGYRIRSRVPGDPAPGDDFLSAGVTIRLPVNRAKWRERVAEREAQLRRARAEFHRTRLEIEEAIRARHADLRRADEAARLLRDGLVPQARQSLESNRAGYEVDRVDFLSLIDAWVRLFDAELRLERTWADRHRAFAALEAAVGEPLR